MSNAKRVLRYLKATQNYGIFYDNRLDEKFTFYSDSDYANCPQTRKSVSASMIHSNGGPIFWASSRQSCVSLSTTEAELIAATETAKATVWFCELVNELGYREVPKILIDNEATIKLVKDDMFHKRSKHIDLKYFYIRQLVEEKRIEVGHIPTEYQKSDILSKPLNEPTFVKLRNLIGIKPVTNEDS